MAENKENKKVETVSTLSPTVEVPTNQEQKKVEKPLITLKGITTSQIRKREKLSDTPAYCFLKTDERKEDIPVIFRMKGKPVDRNIMTNNDKYCLNCSAVANYPNQLSHSSWCQYNKEGKKKPEENNQWIKPKIKKGSYLQVEGQWTIKDPSYSNRKSFTALSYQLLNSKQSQVEYLSHDRK